MRVKGSKAVTRLMCTVIPFEHQTRWKKKYAHPGKVRYMQRNRMEA